MKPEPAITATPHLQGQYAKAWAVDINHACKRAGIPPECSAVLSVWIVEAPWAHPVWHSYAIYLVHLRPVRNSPDAIIFLADATHEITVHAIDPECDRNTMLIKGYGTLLAPVNFAAQFIEVEDELAIGRVRNAVQKICDGTLNPDTDFVHQWLYLFGSNILKH